MKIINISHIIYSIIGKKESLSIVFEKLESLWVTDRHMFWMGWSLYTTKTLFMGEEVGGKKKLASPSHTKRRSDKQPITRQLLHQYICKVLLIRFGPLICNLS